MRWYWIDRFTEFVSGQYATAIKSVALSEELLHDHFPGAPILPASLVIEGLAQTGGLLVGQVYDFKQRVILAKLSKAVIHFHPKPGDTLCYRAEIRQISDDGAMVTASSHVDSELQAEAEIFFAHLDDRRQDKLLFDAEDFQRWLRLLKFYEVGVYPDGTRLAYTTHV